MLCGTALRNKGLQPLLDAVIDLLPSPEDVPPVRGTDPRTGARRPRASRASAAPLCALAFKVMTAEDRRLTYLRIYSGRLRAGDTVLDATRGQEEKVARLFRMHANKRERLEEAVAGDIVAAAGLKIAATGDTLTDPRHPLLLEPMRFSNPVITLAVEPRASADTDRLALALGKLAAEDPTLAVRTDPESGQNVVSGMGELHLEIVLDRLEREFRVPVRSGRPQVIYRETISARGRPRRGVPARGQRAVGARRGVRCTSRPLPRGAGERVLLGPLPAEPPEPIAAAVRGGITDSLGAGMLAGYPLVDLEARVTRVLFRPDDTLAVGFRIAAARAFREATGAGRAAPARAADAPGGGDAGGVHGGDHPGPRRAPRAGSTACTRTGRCAASRPSRRCASCSATPRACARSPRGAPRSPCTSPGTARRPPRRP